MTTIPAMSWYGKLPSAGDFLQRRFPDTLQRQWLQWFQIGLHNWKKDNEQMATERQFGNAPIWNFIVPPMLGSQLVQMGCLLPGRDSVGRQYPLCALLAFNPAEWSMSRLMLAGNWYQQVGQTLWIALRNGYSAEQLDRLLSSIPAPQQAETEKHSDIMEIIGGAEEVKSTLAWPQAAECFEPQRQTSFWWTNRSDGYPLYTHVHSGNFTGQLFSLLFDPAGGARPGRHGLYPPMFE